MKKFFIAVALIATLGSCSSEPKFYFAEIENKTVNDPNAEFDTLSYALGMNYALYLQLTARELQYDNELMAQTFIETFEKGLNSFVVLDEAQKELNKYQTSHLAAYNRAIQKRRMLPNVDVIVPEVYDEEFTNTMFTSMISRVNALNLMTQNTPFNAHYIAMGIRDAKNVAADSLIDSTMKISVREMMMSMQKFQRGQLTNNIKAQADAWLADIATRPNVKALEINGDTIYYRINNPGGIKPEGKDSIDVNYALYSYRGRLIESTESHIKAIEETIDLIKADSTINDIERNNRIKMATESLNKAKDRTMVLDNFNIAAIKECLPLIGEFGSITIWAPAKYVKRNMRLLNGEHVVINVELNKVTKGANNIVVPVLPKKIPGKNLPGKAAIEPQQGGKMSAKTVTLTPANKGEKKPVPAKLSAAEKK